MSAGLRSVLALPVRRAVLGLAAGLTLLASSLALPGGAAASTPCTDPPEVFPVESLEPGMMATGWTVIEGRDPVSFDVEILGVQPNGIAPGLDFILIQVSGDVITETGGIVSGFSGSPVYIGDALVGAVAYGFWGGDPTIGGVTPGQAMVDILMYPSPLPEPTVAEAAEATEVRLTDQMRRAAARATGAAVAHVPQTMRQLAIPLSISGANDRGMRRVQEWLTERDLPFLPYVGGSAAAPEPGALAEEPLGPGDSFAGVLSYGDITWAGIGTTTAVCGDRAVAFGHPFNWEGPLTDVGMNGADVLTVFSDPTGLGGGFKIANVAETHGTMDQDRLAGIRGVEGVLPPTVPVTSETLNLDLGRSMSGRTDVVRATGWWLPSITWVHLYSSIDATYDRLGSGSLMLDWTISGKRASGDPFELARENVYWAQWDTSWEGLDELDAGLNALALSGEMEGVTFTGVDAEAAATQEKRVAEIMGVRSSSLLQPALRERSRLKVRPGETIHLQVILQPAYDPAEQTVDLNVKIPRRARKSGSIGLRGGWTSTEEIWELAWGAQEGWYSFDEILEILSGVENNNDLMVSMRVKRAGRRSAVFAQDDVVEGFASLRLRVIR